jgi:hypothetical protein
MAIDKSEYNIEIKTTSEGHESVHELREKFHLLKLAAGEALGPISELGHFLASPELLGVAVATLAVKSYIEHLQEAAEQTRKNIEAAQAFRDFLAENHNRTVLEAAEDIHRWNLELQHARENVDLLGQALQRNNEISQQNLANTNDLISAQERLADAITHARQANGELTPGQATAEQQHAREVAQHAHDAAEDAEKQAEIAERRRTASGYAGQADVAESDLAGLNVGRQQNAEHLGRAANDVAEARKAHDDAVQAANEAQAKTLDIPGPLELANALRQGKSGAEYARELQQDAKDKSEKAEMTKKVLESAVDHQSHLQTEKDTIDESIKTTRELIQTRRDLIEKLKTEADSAEEGLHRHQQGRAAVESVARQTDAVNLRAANAEMVRRVQSGQGTAGEQEQVQRWLSEAGASQEHGPQAGIDASGAITRGRTMLATLQGGRGRAGQMGEVHALLDQITGLLESHDSYVQDYAGQLQDIARRLGTLESVNRTGGFQTSQ